MDLRRDIYFYATATAFPTSGSLNVLYVDRSTGIIYSWNGTSYAPSGAGSTPTGLNYQGLWDANANLPLITSSVGTVGDYYIVGTAGTTNINGINDWGIGDWIVFSSTNVWQKIDNSDTTFTGYDYEVHVSQVDGNDTTGDGGLLNPVATITYALTLLTGSRKTIIVHPGSYSENVTVANTNTTIATTELTGANTLLSGTLTIGTLGSGSRISGLKMSNLVISGTAQAYISNCTVDNQVTKSSSGFVEIINSEMQCISGIQISGAGTIIINGNKNVGISVSNASAQVIIKGCNSVVTPSASAGNLAIVDCIVTALGGNGITITGASTTLTLLNSQVLVTAGNSVAPISVAGIYSIINTIYDKPGSTLTGTSTNSIDYFQYINADKFIKQGGTASGFLKADGSVDSTAYQAALTLTTTGTSGAATLVGSTLNVPQYAGSSSGKFGVPDANGAYTYYTTLALAIAAASAGDTIEMFTDVTDSTSTPVELKPNVNINGNGHTYNHTSNSGATFTITDTAGTKNGDINLYNFNIKRTTTASSGNPIFTASSSYTYLYNTFNFYGCKVSYTSTSGATPCFDGGNLSSAIINGLDFTSNGSGNAISTAFLVDVNNSIINCTGTSSGINSTGTIKNCIINVTSGVGINTSTPYECTVFASTSGTCFRTPVAYNCTAFSNTGYCFDGSYLGSNTVYNCIARTTSGVGYWSSGCISSSAFATTGKTIDLHYSYGADTYKFYNNFFYASTAPAVDISSVLIMDSSIFCGWNSASGHGIRMSGTTGVISNNIC